MFVIIVSFTAIDGAHAVYDAMRATLRVHIVDLVFNLFTDSLTTARCLLCTFLSSPPLSRAPYHSLDTTRYGQG